jgi:hypothetical protein
MVSSITTFASEPEYLPENDARAKAFAEEIGAKQER